ncbi:MAG TPA: AtpZ/AtpI family protein [Gemmataceae bacterium]|nr:AtpZ/AtpI family protein [Gemmataceae bacterium]
MFPEPGDRRELGRYLALSQIGLEMVVPIIAGLLVDYYLGWTPWATITGAVLGLCGGLVHLVHMLNKLDAKDSSPSDRESR